MTMTSRRRRPGSSAGTAAAVAAAVASGSVLCLNPSTVGAAESGGFDDTSYRRLFLTPSTIGAAEAGDFDDTSHRRQGTGADGARWRVLGGPDHPDPSSSMNEVSSGVGAGTSLPPLGGDGLLDSADPFLSPPLPSSHRQQQQQQLSPEPATNNAPDPPASGNAEPNDTPTSTGEPNPASSIVPRLRRAARTDNDDMRKRRRSKAGRITIDFGSSSARMLPLPSPPLPPLTPLPESVTAPKLSADAIGSADGEPAVPKWVRNRRVRIEKKATAALAKSGAGNDGASSIQLSLSPPSLLRLLHPVLFTFSSHFVAAFVGTLRLLGPLILARRSLLFLFSVLSDYLRGRYFRKTYTRLERAYLRYYEAPAAFRALCRTSAQLAVLFGLSVIMGWLVGVTHPPCHTDGRGLAALCGTLWLGAVVGTGHAFSTAVAVWGGPLRIQSDAQPPPHEYGRKHRVDAVRRVFTRPWHALGWMRNPEEWISMIGAREVRKPPFRPVPVIFPMTWAPLRLLLICAVARVLAAEPSCYLWAASGEGKGGAPDPIPRLMRRFLVQLALGDEWYRVFLGERRVGLGIVVGMCHLVALVATIVTSVSMTGLGGAALMVPSLLAVVVSGWMNIVIFWNRLDARRQREAIEALEVRKRAALSAFAAPSPQTASLY